MLADELGVEPGPEVRRLHERILAHDPALLRATVAAKAPVVMADEPRAVEVHLPRRGTRLVGRDDERRGVAAQLTKSRVVTIVGTGGCGKTRLAVAAAEGARDLFTDGVWSVDLSTVTDADPGSVGTGRRPRGRDSRPRPRPAPDSPRRTVRLRRRTGGAPAAGQLRTGRRGRRDHRRGTRRGRACGRALATSRQPLGVDGEVLQKLAPLALPVADTPDALAASPAVTLFLERIRAAVSLPRSTGRTARRSPASARPWTVCRWGSSSPRPARNLHPTLPTRVDRSVPHAGLQPGRVPHLVAAPARRRRAARQRAPDADGRTQGRWLPGVQL